jgi:hypothetical protein
MMLRNLFKKVQHPQSPYSYHTGPIYTNGALEMVFNKKWAYPVVLIKGAGQVAGQWASRQAPQLRAQLALTSTTLKAAGQYAGQINFQPLTDDSPDPNAAIGAT